MTQPLCHFFYFILIQRSINIPFFFNSCDVRGPPSFSVEVLFSRLNSPRIMTSQHHSVQELHDTRAGWYHTYRWLTGSKLDDSHSTQKGLWGWESKAVSLWAKFVKQHLKKKTNFTFKLDSGQSSKCTIVFPLAKRFVILWYTQLWITTWSHCYFLG